MRYFLLMGNSPDTKVPRTRPVLAPLNDPKGFSPELQQDLRTRIICEHLAPIFGFIPKPESIPEVPIMKVAPQPQSPERGLVRTHVAANVIPSNDQSAAEKERVRREATG